MLKAKGPWSFPPTAGAPWAKTPKDPLAAKLVVDLKAVDMTNAEERAAKGIRIGTEVRPVDGSSSAAPPAAKKAGSESAGSASPKSGSESESVAGSEAEA